MFFSELKVSKFPNEQFCFKLKNESEILKVLKSLRKSKWFPAKARNHLYI